MDSDACCEVDAADPEADSPCPRCGRTGPVVGTEPVRAHRPDATLGSWHYCPTTSCPVVFYLRDETINTDSVVTRVGHKATHQSVPVCFCFAHTAEALAADAEENGGVSTIKAEIRSAVARGSCACEHLNPSSQCCLPEVHQVLRRVDRGTT